MDLHGLRARVLELTPVMILYSTPPSPFGRKVKIVAKLLGLWDKIESVEPRRLSAPDGTQLTDYALTADNPLGKMPTLVLEDGRALYDSAVIAEFLDQMGGGGIIFPRTSERWEAITMASLADGMMDAALLLRYEETLREPDKRSSVWIDSQRGKIERALDLLESSPPGLGSPPHIGEIGVACALGYLDLRFSGVWRQGRPKLTAWLDAFARAVPAFEATRVAA